MQKYFKESCEDGSGDCNEHHRSLFPFKLNVYWHKKTCLCGPYLVETVCLTETVELLMSLFKWLGLDVALQECKYEHFQTLPLFLICYTQYIVAAIMEFMCCPCTFFFFSF